MTRDGLNGLRLLLAAAFLSLAGCSFVYPQPVSLPPVAAQILEYYPHQVKGYQSSYPPRRVTVLPTIDAREFNDATAVPDHEPDAQGNPRIGVVLDRRHQVIQRVYSQPLAGVVQKALADSAEEAGLVPSISDESLDTALKRTNVEYVLASKLVRCWVKKQRGADTRSGPTWATSADFAAEITVYKPPFRTPFWQGATAAAYDDPPLTSFTTGLEDDTSIYDQPGQVLSVALTRAVAGVWRRADLRSLIIEDIVTPR